MVDALIGAGVAVNLQSILGNRPLKLAKKAGKTGVASLLWRTAAPCENGAGKEEDSCGAFGATPHFTPPQYSNKLSTN